MARFRVETVTDPITGKVYSELFYPDDAAAPIGRTKPIYDSHPEAAEHAERMLKEMFPD